MPRQPRLEMMGTLTLEFSAVTTTQLRTNPGHS